MFKPSLPHRLCNLLLTLAAAGCSSATEPAPVAQSVSANTSLTFTATVGSQVTPAPSVTVMSNKGTPMVGVEVVFSVNGGGSISGGTVKTDAQGVAAVGGWTLGTRPGSYSLTAAVGSLTPVSFAATAVPGPATSVALVSGSGQSGSVGQPVAAPIIVEARDGYANAVPSTRVTVSVMAGGGTLGGTSVTTGGDGRAVLPNWTLGTAAGPQTLRVSAGTGTVEVTATATAGTPTQLILVQGNEQAGDLGVPLTDPLRVRVADQYGNGVSGITVTYAPSAGVTISSPSVISAADGMTQVQATLQRVGESAVVATAGSLPAVSFSLSTGPTLTGVVNNSTTDPQWVAVAVRQGNSLVRAQGSAARKSLPAAARPNSRGHILVTFKSVELGLTQSAASYRSNRELNQIAAARFSQVIGEHLSSSRLAAEVRSLPVISTALVQLRNPAEQEQVMAELRRDPRVLRVEPDQIVTAPDPGVARVVESIPLIPPIWPGLTMTLPLGQAVQSERYGNDPVLKYQMWHYRMIDAPRAWKNLTGSSAVRIGVLGGGVRLDHPQLAGVLSATEGFDFVDGSAAWDNPRQLCEGGTFQTYRGPGSIANLPRNGLHPMQYVYKGACWERDAQGSTDTFAAGIIASAGDDGVGGAGVNWQGTIVPIRVYGVTGEGWWSDVIQGILYAGGFPTSYTGAPPGFEAQIPPLPIVYLGFVVNQQDESMATAIAAIQPTTLAIALVGHGNSSAPDYPASYPGVVSVSALDPLYAKASYSNYGSGVVLAAPGGDFSGNIARTVSSAWDFQAMKPIYATVAGTYVAAAHVTGVAGLIKAANPGFTAEQIRQRLISGAIDLGPAGRDNIYGYGLVNAYRSVTGTSGPALSTTVRLINASGAVVRTVKPGTDGRYTFTRLPEGSYRVVASQDESGDGLFGAPGRRFGISAMLTVGGTEVKTLNVVQGQHDEKEPNNAVATAQVMTVDSWVWGFLGDGEDPDLFSLDIPVTGTYTFETSGRFGACGYGVDSPTALRLLDGSGTMIASNVATLFPQASYPGDRCSLITTNLSPGRYYVEVRPDPVSTGRGYYRLHLRSGS